MRFPTMATVVAVAMFTLAACGGAGAPTATPTSAPTATVGTPPTDAPITPPPAEATPTAGTSEVDLCSLLTAEDLNTVLEGNFLEGELTSTGGYCHWDSGMNPADSVITATDDRSLETIKSAGSGGVDMTVGGHAAYSVRDDEFHLQTTFIDLGGPTLILEFPTSSNAEDDLADAQELAEIAVTNL